MSQGNQFYQYGYDHYLKAPQKKPQHRAQSTGFAGMIKAKMRSPLVATIALLCAGGVFAGVIISAYPSKQDEQVQVPIVKADLRPIRITPEEPGGMAIPHRDSTVLAELGQESSFGMQQGNEKIENLFAAMPQERDVMTKEEALAQAGVYQMEQDGVAFSGVDEMPQIAQMPALTDPYQAAPSLESEEDFAMHVTNEEIPSLLPETVMAEPTPEVVAPVVNANAASLLQKIGGTHDDQSAQVEEQSEFVAQAAKAAAQSKPAAPKAVVAQVSPKTIHAPATSPETLDFVRSVLNEDAASQVSSVKATPIRPEAVEPAAGAATSAQAIAAGEQYFVQLASITDSKRASTEYQKMQASYNALVSWNFRVQEASLASGTFYRIQAGPMSKLDADRVCASLKAQGKPGGCLVVK